MLKERALDFCYGQPDIGSGHLFDPSGSQYTLAKAELEELDTEKGMLMVRSKGISAAYASMTDVVTGTVGHEKFISSHNQRPTFNSCEHICTRGVNYPYSASFIGRNPSYVNLHRFNRRLQTGYSAGDVIGLTSHFNTVHDLGQARRTAWGEMQPRFEGDVSLFNFILELRDFKRIAGFLLRNPLKKIRNMFRRIIKRKKLDPTKPLAELHLFNEFAIKPLLSDIYKLTMQLHTKITDLQNNFADAGRTRNTRHYTEVFPVFENNLMGAYYAWYYPYWMGGESEQFTFNASMQYSYEYDMRNTLAAFLKYYGIIPDAEAIWDAIPFSFIVDYFLRVGNALDINSRDKNVLLDLHQYCESFLSERSKGLHFTADHLYGPLLGAGSFRYPGTEGNYVVSGAQSTFYTRILNQPDEGRVLPRLHKPTTKQGWNLLALLRVFF